MWRVEDIHEHVGMCITEVHNTVVFQGFVMSNPHKIRGIWQTITWNMPCDFLQCTMIESN